jgi:hypothetical protein
LASSRAGPAKGLTQGRRRRRAHEEDQRHQRRAGQVTTASTVRFLSINESSRRRQDPQRRHCPTSSTPAPRATNTGRRRCSRSSTDDASSRSMLSFGLLCLLLGVGYAVRWPQLVVLQRLYLRRA